MENVLPIIGFEDAYEISDCGEIRNINHDRFLHPTVDMYGYYKVTLWKNRTKHTKSVHRLVALAFIPNPNNKPQINHRNGIKTDNRIENLEWITNLDNIRHAQRNGFREGMRIANSRILIDIQTGVFYDSAIQLAALLGVDRCTVREWLQGRGGENKFRYRYA